ncbi:MAG TPA: VWA domain-containing protein [Trueperaceae bacterium]
MIFLQPWWWLLALLAVPLVLWHARNPRFVTVPSLLIWKTIAAKLTPIQSARRRFHWRLNSSLLLQLLSLFALIVALAGPRPADEVVEHQIFLLDVSRSMTAPDGEGSRLDAATTWLRQALGATDAAKRGGPQLSVVTLAEDPTVLLARADEPREAVLALNGVSPEFGNGPVPISRARLILRGLLASDSTRITVLTDTPGSRTARQILEPWLQQGELEIDLSPFGTPLETHGFSGLNVSPLDTEEGGWLVQGRISAYPPPAEPLTVKATFLPAGTEGALPWEELSVRFRGEQANFAFETEFPGPGLLHLELPDDELPLDNTARILVRTEPLPLRVLLAGEVPKALTEALRMIPGAAFVEAEPTAQLDSTFDLAVVGPGYEATDRRAPVVLWLSGMRQGGGQGAPLAVPTELWPGHGALRWSGVTDIPTLATMELHALPPAGDAIVLLRSDQGPLLQVVEGDDTIDVQSAWAIGEGSWARELGFAQFLTELAVAAQPLHGQLTGARCIIGQYCFATGSRLTRVQPGVHEHDGRPIVVDMEASPETDLDVELEKFGSEAKVPFPWARIDRLLALLAALLLALDSFRALRRRLASNREVGPIAHWASVVARLASVAALLLLALGVDSPTLLRHERTALVIDPSTVTNPPVREVLGSALERARAVVSMRGPGELAAPRVSLSTPKARLESSSGYDLVSALELGFASLGPQGGRLVVGVPEGDDASSGIVAPPGVKVDLLPLPHRSEEARITAVELPDTVRSGDVIEIRIASSVPAGESHDVEVFLDDERLERSGTGHVFEWRAEEPGPHRVRARFVGSEDELVRLVEVEPGGRVALLVNEEEAAAELAALLEKQYFEVTTWTPYDVPVSPEGLLEFDAVVLLDVPAVDLHPLMQESIERWVREYGGGVLIAGAKDAFGPGGYLRTPLEELSPLSARVPGEQPQAAIAFVLDRSGSMQQTVAGVSRLAFTKQATIEAVELLHPDSRVAIILFDDIAHVLKPIGPPGDVGERLEQITPGGGTNIYPALQVAFRQLQATDAEAKHIIVMTDGLSQNAPFGPLLESIAAADITVSTVAVGQGADVALLEDIARLGGGAFHRSEDVRSLPSILSQEAMLLSGNPVRKGPVEPRFDPRRAVFLEKLPEKFPQVQGYVRTTLKPEAEVHARTEEGDPLLASWRHGIGRVVALSTPVTGEWGEAWTDSEFATEFLQNTLLWLAAPIQQPGLALDLRQVGDSLLAEARILDDTGQPVEGARVIAWANGPQGRVGPVLLDEVGRGAYAGSLDAFDKGRYEVRAKVTGGEDWTDEASAFVSRHSSERPGTGRAELVSELMRMSGGRLLLDDGSGLVSDRLTIELTPRLAVWAWLAVTAWLVALTLEALGMHRASRPGSNHSGRRQKRRGAGRWAA